MTPIMLSESEQAIAQYLATARTVSNRTGGIANKRVGPQSDELTDLNGIGGELAFCRLVNVWPDVSISPRKGGADCLVRDKRVDVKTTTYETGRLVVVPGKGREDADIYVLMVGTFPGPYRVAGWAYASEVLMAERLTDLGHGPTYAVPQDELRAWSTRA